MQRFHVLACDYDGTLATQGTVDRETLKSLEAVRQSGRKLVMVTGRRLEELVEVFPEPRRFDRIVAENGAIVFDPASGEETVLAEAPPEAFVRALAERGVSPVAFGRAIVATWEPYEMTVLEVIRDLGLGLQIILNKGAVMILPAGLSKATGLASALGQLGYSPRNTVGVGDAENDHALLDFCECGAAVANAVGALKERADVVLPRDHGAGVSDLIDELLRDDLSSWSSRCARRTISLGKCQSGDEVAVRTYGDNVAICAESSATAGALVSEIARQLGAHQYQWCLISESQLPDVFSDVAVFGSSRVPALDELRHALENPTQRALVSCAHLSGENRGDFTHSLLQSLAKLRAGKGRPHWIICLGTSEFLQELSTPLREFEGGVVVAASGGGPFPDDRWLARAIVFADQATCRSVLSTNSNGQPPIAGERRGWSFGLTDGQLWFDRLTSENRPAAQGA